MKPRVINGLYLSTAILLWLVLLFFFFWNYRVIPMFDEETAPQSFSFYFRLVYAAFLLLNLSWMSRLFGKIEKLNVITLLWRLFIVGMIGIAVILLLIIAHNQTQNYHLTDYLRPIFFSLGQYAWLIFFLAAIFIFRRFIIYQRTRRKMQAWWGFLILLISTQIFAVFPGSFEFMNIGYIVYGAFVILSLLLASNVRWVAYLNFNQKLRALGLFALILVVIITYGFAASRFPNDLYIPIETLPGRIFLNFIFIFPIIYSSFSILVLFFNLPNSSIFELKGLEIASFNQINQAIQSNLDFSGIMTSLLDASVLSANVSAGWIETISETDGSIEQKYTKRITEKEIAEIKQGMDLTEKVIKDQKPYLVKNLQRHRAFRGSESKYRSLLVVPIVSHSNTYGAVYVVNDLQNSFEDVTVKAVRDFAEQAGIALENAKLVKSSIDMERYQEQLKIAQQVQSQLLPSKLPSSDRLVFAAKNENAEEVGGDYFDVIQPSEHVYRVAIGDIAGKGTTAAFYMAEIKGIFHALARMNLDVRNFVSVANQALSECMRKGVFMTFTYAEIDMEKKVLKMIRAGHCPAYYYCAEEGQLKKLMEGAPGLGLVRNDSYKNFLQEPTVIHFNPGDFMVLYTDGIIEARNDQKEEFGYERLETIIEMHKNGSPENLASSIAEGAKAFCQEKLQDDYTVLVLKFL